MYQVEKVHKQKSIELKKELLNFVFFFSSNEGGGNCQRKSKKVIRTDRGTNNGPKPGTCTTSTKSSSKSSKALPLMRSALMHIVSFEIIERLG